MTGNPHHSVTDNVPWHVSWLPVTCGVIVGLALLVTVLWLVTKDTN